MTPDLHRQLQASLGTAYTLERELSGGAMARVFVAIERRLGRQVVIKVLRPEPAAAVSAQRFEQEIQLAARLQNPRIVPLLAAGEAGGLPFYTMPFVEGESLRARLDRGRLPFAEAIAVLRDVALALEYAHAQGVVHRDIKPENILLAGRTAMVTDFGIAKALALAAAGGPRLTSAGMAIGTPAYMSPEQAAGGGVDQRTDIYAWGVMAYELLAGVHPFADRITPQSLIAAQIAEPAPAIPARAARIPRSVAAIVDRALAKDPTGRPTSATELIHALDGAVVSRRPRPVPQGSRRSLLIGLGLVLLAGGAILGLALRDGEGPTERRMGARTPLAIAVLPFANVGGDTTDRYFAEGMADELITALANVPGLRVAARSSTARFAGERVSPREVGNALQVNAVLDGTVRRAGDRLRLTAQLTNAADGLVIWADRYDRHRSDVLTVQDEVTRGIVAALREALGMPADSGAGAPRGTADLLAYDDFLKGRYFFGKRGEDGLLAAIDYFGRASLRDPDFARAHAGLAMAYVVLPVFTDRFGADSLLALAERHANRAMALDSTMADPHLALAYARKAQWRWEESERHFRDAVTLDHDDPLVHHWYGVLLYAMGRADEAVDRFVRARELDPFASAIGADGAVAFYGARRFVSARIELDRAIRLDSTKSDNYVVLGMVHLALGQPDSALRALDAARRFGTGLETRSIESVAHHRLGDFRAARTAYARVRQAYARRRATGYDLAIAAVVAGDTALALTGIERAVRERNMLVTEFTMPCDPLLDPLRAVPRFASLLARAGMKACGPRPLT